MRPMILMAAVVGLASGLLGAFAYGELFGSATAAPPATAVREQNLDGNGLIRVHEQGTANVTGTVDVGNLPAVQDVNVVAMPAQDSGPQEFTHVMARMCTTNDLTFPGGGGTTGFCGFGDPPTGSFVPLDVNAELTALSAQGWRLVTVSTPSYYHTYNNRVTDIVIYTLSRPAP